MKLSTVERNQSKFQGIIIIIRSRNAKLQGQRSVDQMFFDQKTRCTNFQIEFCSFSYACFQGYHLVGPPVVECRYGNWYSDAPATYPTCSEFFFYSGAMTFNRKTVGATTIRKILKMLQLVSIRRA
jgi:hypothetical protein